MRVSLKLISHRRTRVNYDVNAANGTTIPTYGWLPLSLNLGLRRDFTWRFVVANVTQPLIGANFLSCFGLLVDCRNNRLLDGFTSLFTPVKTANLPTSIVKITGGGTSVDTLLSEFPDLTHLTGLQREVHHNTIHHIWTSAGPPVTCQPRRLTPHRLTIAKAEFDVVVRDGTARRSEFLVLRTTHRA
jgi:cleavage and polyadenylation specificity factor subunit 1